MKASLSALFVTICVTAGALCCPQATAAKLKFTVALDDSLNSSTARAGQVVHARLTADLYRGKKLLAPAGSLVSGKVTGVERSRRLLHAEVSPKRWLRAGGGLRVRFDRITPPHGQPIKISAVPDAVFGQKTEGGKSSQTVKVDSHSGTVETTRKKDLKPKAARTALGIGAIVAAPVTSVIGGVAGALRPSTVLPEAQTARERQHRHLKGLATGFVAGLPGGFLIDDAVLKGRSAVLPKGTRLELTAP